MKYILGGLAYPLIQLLGPDLRILLIQIPSILSFPLKKFFRILKARKLILVFLFLEPYLPELWSFWILIFIIETGSFYFRVTDLIDADCMQIEMWNFYCLVLADRFWDVVVVRVLLIFCDVFCLECEVYWGCIHHALSIILFLLFSPEFSTILYFFYLLIYL